MPSSAENTSPESNSVGSKRKKIVISSLDGDDCLFHRNGYLEENSNVLEQNYLLFAHLQDQLKDKDKGTLYVGSNRQSLPIDILNSRPSGNGRTARPRRESFLKIFPMIADVLKRASGKDVNYSRQLLPDIVSSLPTGTTYYSALKEYEDNPNISTDEPLQYKYRHPLCPMDESKILLLYSQMHDAALANPNCDITFNFYDDGENLLKNLYYMYSTYPKLIPKNISLNLFLYNGTAAPTPVKVFNQQDPSELFESKPLSGEGSVNANYRHDIKSLFYLGSKEQREATGSSRKRNLFSPINTANDSEPDFNAYHLFQNKEGVYFFIRHLAGDMFQPDEENSQNKYSPDSVSPQVKFNHAYEDAVKPLATDGISEDALSTHTPSFTEEEAKIHTAAQKLKPSSSEPANKLSVADEPTPLPLNATLATEPNPVEAVATTEEARVIYNAADKPTTAHTVTPTANTAKPKTNSPKTHDISAPANTSKGYSLVVNDIIKKYHITIPNQVDLITNAINEANQEMDAFSIFASRNFKNGSKEKIAGTSLLDEITNEFKTEKSPAEIKTALIPKFQKAADALRDNKHGTNFLIFLAGCLDVILSIISLSIYAWVTGLKSNTLFFAQKTHNDAIKSKAARSTAIQNIQAITRKTDTLVDALNSRGDNSATPS